MVALGLCAAAVAVAPPSAQAQRRSKMVIQELDGARGTSVRRQLEAGLRARRIQIYDQRAAMRAARQRALSSDGDYARVGARLRVTAFVGGEVFRDGREWTTILHVRGADGLQREDLMYSHRSFRAMANRVKARAPRDVLRLARLRTVTPGAAPSEPAEPAAEPLDVAAVPDADRSAHDTGWNPRGEAPPDRDVSADTDAIEAAVEADRVDALDPELYGGAGGIDAPGAPFRSRHSPLSVGVGLRSVSRSFSYPGDTAGKLPYSLPFGPAVALDATWFPAAHFRNGPLADLGVHATYSRSLFLRSANPDGPAFDTDESLWSVGARYRLTLGPVGLRADVGLARHGFSVEAASVRDLPPAIASVEYTALAAGAAITLPLPARMRLELHGGYAFVFGRGEIGQGQHYPDGTARGFDVGVAATYPLGHGFEVRGGVDARVYLHDLGNDTTPRAVDRYIHVHAGVAWHWQPELSAEQVAEAETLGGEELSDDEPALDW